VLSPHRSLLGVPPVSVDERLAAVTDHERRFTRRAVLGATVAAVAACTSRHRDTPADPDAEAVAAARAGELLLLAPLASGTPAHTAHVAHLRALGGTPPTPGTTPTAAPAPAYADQLASVPVLQSAARRAHSGRNAAVLASIAASHAVLDASRP
jgi:hypothetical protein